MALSSLPEGIHTTRPAKEVTGMVGELEVSLLFTSARSLCCCGFLEIGILLCKTGGRQ